MAAAPICRSDPRSTRPKVSGILGDVSWVANVLLVVSVVEQESLVRDFSEWLATEAPWNEPSVPAGATGVGSLESLVGEGIRWGGAKYPECRVWGGVLDHADVDVVVQRFGAIPWISPGSVQLLVMDQEQTYFRLWMIRDGRPQQCAPTPDPGDKWSA